MKAGPSDMCTFRTSLYLNIKFSPIGIYSMNIKSYISPTDFRASHFVLSIYTCNSYFSAKNNTQNQFSSWNILFKNKCHQVIVKQVQVINNFIDFLLVLNVDASLQLSHYFPHLLTIIIASYHNPYNYQTWELMQTLYCKLYNYYTLSDSFRQASGVIFSPFGITFRSLSGSLGIAPKVALFSLSNFHLASPFRL